MSTHSSLKPYFSFMALSSWLPRTSQIFLGKETFSAKSSPMTASEWSPRSTKSPLKTKHGASWPPTGKPKATNRSSRSRSCPWMSPKILAGEGTSANTGCAIKILRVALPNNTSVSKYSVLNKRSRRPVPRNSHSQSYLSLASVATSLASCSACLTTSRARSTTPAITVWPPRSPDAAQWILRFTTWRSPYAVKSRTLVCSKRPTRIAHNVTFSWSVMVGARLRRLSPPGRSFESLRSWPPGRSLPCCEDRPRGESEERVEEPELDAAELADDPELLSDRASSWSSSPSWAMDFRVCNTSSNIFRIRFFPSTMS
mmetsp:Transcript_38100/g.97343  ORF Transcript_38100/g.97343 Transcript_38100/m.97343 type:complete len:314 (-) Transcript_38100:179-1120(-)